jgi:protein-tyrosine phosphatase
VRVPPPPASPDASSALLVVDARDGEARRFRAAAWLRCSGSAQFSTAGWQDVLARLGRPAPADLYVVDLREESHGFVNGAAVSWYARDNWGCVGLAAEDALRLEALRLRLLALGDTVEIASADEVKRGATPARELWPRRAVEAEREVVGLPEGHYLRLLVTDHLAPRDEVVDAFVRFVRGLDGRPHLHFHCRGGRGRTTVFIALYDMLRNAVADDCAAILERNQRLGDYDFAERRDPASRKAPYAPERLALLERFHRYARANPGGAPLGWLDWIGGDGA